MISDVAPNVSSSADLAALLPPLKLSWTPRITALLTNPPSGDGGPDNDGMDAPNVNHTLVDVDDVDTNADDANIDNDELTQE